MGAAGRTCMWCLRFQTSGLEKRIFFKGKTHLVDGQKNPVNLLGGKIGEWIFGMFIYLPCLLRVFVGGWGWFFERATRSLWCRLSPKNITLTWDPDQGVKDISRHEIGHPRICCSFSFDNNWLRCLPLPCHFSKKTVEVNQKSPFKGKLVLLLEGNPACTSLRLVVYLIISRVFSTSQVVQDIFHQQ